MLLAPFPWKAINDAMWTLFCSIFQSVASKEMRLASADTEISWYTDLMVETQIESEKAKEYESKRVSEK